jgi:hypothetical protein
LKEFRRENRELRGLREKTKSRPRLIHPSFYSKAGSKAEGATVHRTVLPLKPQSYLGIGLNPNLESASILTWN